MKVIAALLLAMFLANLCPIPARAGTEISSPPAIHGEAAILVDVQSGQILYSKNPDEQLAPASTTKIMTGLLAIERGKLDELVTASPTMLDRKQVYGTRIYLDPGEQLTLGDLLYALLLNSANDAAVAIAEHIGGNQQNFVDMMNRRAEELGASRTHFVNPSGLNAEGHVSTARDLARIARAAMANPVFAAYVRTKTHLVHREKAGVPVEMYNENKLLWRDSSVDGIKTGYTVQAGNCLVASATHGNRQLIGVILKSPGSEIYPDMSALLDYGFNAFADQVYKPAGSSLDTVVIGRETINLVLSEPIYVTVPDSGGQADIRLEVARTVNNVQQINEGEVLGEVGVWQGDNLLKTLPLRADRTGVARKPVSGLISLNRSLVAFIVLLALLVLSAPQIKQQRKRRLNKRLDIRGRAVRE